MFVKKTKKQKVLLISLLVSLLLAVSAYFAYDWWDAGSFKRAYEHGTTAEQLSTLMTTTRYVQDIRNGGYLVDQYDIVENGEVTNLETNGSPKLIVHSPGGGNQFYVRTTAPINNSLIEVFLDFKDSMKLLNISFYYGSGGKYNGTVDKATEEKLVKYVQEEVKKIPRDVYEAKYGKKK